MRKIHVLHAVYSWLPVTQNWIYTQVNGGTEFRSNVVSVTEECGEQFPFSDRTVAFPPNGIVNRVGLLLSRYWIRQPHAFFRRTLEVIKPDLVHGHFAHESWRLLHEVRKKHLPLVTTFYGLDVDKLSRRHRWKVRYSQLFSYGAAFTVEGPFMGSRLEALGCSPDKIHVVPLGVPDEGYPVSNQSKVEGKPVRVLFTGLSREKKGPFDAADVFITAAALNSDLQLSVVGDGCYRKAFERKLQKAGVFDRVTMYGFCPFRKYRELLGSVDIVLVPSVAARDGDTEGGAPVVCIEAQQTGIPVVGTRHCDIPFVVHHGKSGFLSSEHDVPSMAQDLVTLAADRNLRRRMGEYGQQLVRKQHSVAQQISHLTKVYRQVLAEFQGSSDE